jgi:hypothetical protein
MEVLDRVEVDDDDLPRAEFRALGIGRCSEVVSGMTFVLRHDM